MLNYTYKYDIQGYRQDCHYITFVFDRVVSHSDVYRSGICRKDATPAVKELMDAVSKTPGVIHNPASNPTDSMLHADLIHASGCELTVKIAMDGTIAVPYLANQIVKKVARRIAKGESRKRITWKKLQARQQAINARSWGKA